MIRRFTSALLNVFLVAAPISSQYLPKGEPTLFYI